MFTPVAQDTAEPEYEAELAAPTPHAVFESVAYVYLLRVVLALPALLIPKAKMPLVELPAAEPLFEFSLADATPTAVDVQVEYVYLLRVAVLPKLQPIAIIPLVELPAAEPCCVDTEELCAEQLTSVEYVYLFLLSIGPQKQQFLPSVNIPFVDSPTALP